MITLNTETILQPTIPPYDDGALLTFFEESNKVGTVLGVPVGVAAGDSSLSSPVVTLPVISRDNSGHFQLQNLSLNGIQISCGLKIVEVLADNAEVMAAIPELLSVGA